MQGTINQTPLRQTKSKAHRHARVGRACLETLEDRRLMSFSPAVNYPIDASTDAIATADFNSDGKLDLVTCANAATGSYSVLLGNGVGGFGAAQRTVIGSQLSTMAVADFNNDAKPDLVVSDDYYRFGTLLGNGDGTFQPPIYTAGGEMATVGDFNNDGNIDVVVNWIDADWGVHVRVYAGDGQGGFVAGLDSPYAYYKVAAVDLNNDGNLDMASGDGSALLGNGNGSLLSVDGQPAPLTGQAIATGDFTGDGKADAIVAGYNDVAVLPGKGDGTFHAPILHTANGTNHTAVATADFNADGKLDALVADGDAGTVSLMLGTGDGTLRYAGAFATGTWPTGVVVGDFNGDGRPDVAVSSSRNVWALFNDGAWGALPLPSLRIADATVTEGNAGTKNFAFTATLSSPSDQPVTVRYATSDGTAAAGSDYQASAGTVTFAPGQTTATIAVPVAGDRLPEANETFSVRLIDPTNASIADGEGAGTILDDEPRLSINDARTTEGKGGTKAMTFTVTLSAAYDQAVTVNFATRNGTATAGEDYVARSGTLTFAPGETVKTITVTVKGDRRREADESFDVLLGVVGGNALLADGSGRGTILNDD